MNLRNFRERANVVLYDKKEPALRIFKFANVLVSLSALVALAVYYGFPLDSEGSRMCLTVIQCSFFFYVFHYGIRILFEWHPLTFLRKTWFEAIISIVLIVEGASYWLSGNLLFPRFFEYLGFSGVETFSNIFIQLYFFTVVIAELYRGGSMGRVSKARWNPAVIFMLSFLGIIVLGTLLLMLPEMTTALGGMGFVDALFTSTSATCVTGLMVEDAATFFTFKGQFVLLTLFQLGGLNMIAFGSFLALASRFGLGVKQHDVIEDFVNKGNFLSSSGMLGKVILWCAGIELIGAALMYLCWADTIDYATFGDRWFFSLFHSVSAFNNAGITLFTDGLTAPVVATNWSIHWLITVLVFLGALGMMALFDLFDSSKLRERMAQPWKHISFASKIALYYSLALVGIGAVAFFILEAQGMMDGISTFGKITTAVFQSVSRTSGFSTVDIGASGVPALFLLIVLMFIGGSSSSTGGGIKTSTLAIVLADAWRTIRGFDFVQLFRRTVPEVLRSRAYSVLLFFLVGNTVCIFLLTITEQHILAMPEYSFFDLVFEEVSAFGTVGHSTGITAELSTAGKAIIIFSMFVGRVGTLTVAFGLGSRNKQNHFKYPEGHTMVG